MGASLNDIKLGDKVRVLGSYEGETFIAGEELIVAGVNTNDADKQLLCQSTDFSQEWFSIDDVEKV